MGVQGDVVKHMLEKLPEPFTFEELRIQIKELRSTKFKRNDKKQAVEAALWLERSNYEVRFGADKQISERVIFPVSENESRGIEDARFVRFVDGGSATYYATYTA
jgi:predicted GH43/DUF377 family glycosyl hydrolase